MNPTFEELFPGLELTPPSLPKRNKAYFRQLLLDFCGYEAVREEKGILYFTDIDFMAELLANEAGYFEIAKAAQENDTSTSKS